MKSLNILDSQYFFLMLHKIIGGTPLVYSVRLKGLIDRDDFKDAVQNLVNANPILQFTFHLPDTAASFSEFTLEKLNNSVLPIHWENLIGQGALEREARISDEYNKLLNVKTTFNSMPLYCFKLFRVASDEIHLLMGIAHVICDGLGGLQLLHQLFSHLSKSPSPFTYTNPDYNRIVEQINQYQPTDEGLATFNTSNSKLKKDYFVWNPNNNKTNISLQQFETVQCKIDYETTKKLIGLTEKLRVSLYSIIVTAYIQYFFSTTTSNKVIFTLPTSGKVYPGIDALDYVGCFAQAISLDFDRKILHQSLPKTVQTVHETIHAAIRSEIDLIHTKKIAQSIKVNFKLENGNLSEFTKTLFRSTIKSNVYISFTGKSPLKRRYDSLEILDYREGTFNNPGVSDWMHSIFDGELYLFANYDSNFFQKQTVETAILYVKNRLYQIVSELDDTLDKTIVNPSLNESDSSIYDYLLSTCSNIGLKHISRDHTHHDLEAELGLDSLSRIRLIARISNDYNNKLSKRSLFMCRTLNEFACVIRKDA